nr:hypothetical protein [Tanacetum cinerariifolium]
VGKGFSRVETPFFESMLVVRDVAEEAEAEAQVLAQGDDVQEPAAEEVVTEGLSWRKGVVIRDPEEELSSDTLAETPKVKDKGKGILIEAPKPMKKKDQ